MAGYKILRGDMPRIYDNRKNLEVSHMCHNGICVTSTHLVLETHETNLERISCKSQGQCTKQHQPFCLL